MISTILSGQAQRELLAYMNKFDAAASAWYCGIAADPRDCLFVRHGVNEQQGAWIYLDCGTDGAARQVETHFHSLGCRGAYGGGGPETRFVYAYAITATTRE